MIKSQTSWYLQFFCGYFQLLSTVTENQSFHPWNSLFSLITVLYAAIYQAANECKFLLEDFLSRQNFIWTASQQCMRNNIPSYYDFQNFYNRLQCRLTTDPYHTQWEVLNSSYSTDHLIQTICPIIYG